jgi:anti-anti-sigma factor
MSPHAPGIVRVDRVGLSTWIVELLGEHDMTNSDRLRDKLVATFGHGTSVVVDLSAATFIDSAIVRELVAAAQGVDETQTEHIAVVAPPGGFPARVFGLLQTSEVFRTFDTRADALAWLEGPDTT